MKKTLVLTLILGNVFLVTPQLAEDGRLDFTGLVNKYGYSCEEHTVITEDGCILKLFRVPGRSTRPILLMHGFMDTADTFMVRGNGSLVVFLASQGHDIWLGNVRGNHYSRAHTQLDPDSDKEFWDFSYHELGYYDLPAIIDYVLYKTKADKLNAIGHSQGNTIFYVMGSTKPQYNDKVNILIALAPVGYMNDLPPPLSLVTRNGRVLNAVLLALDTDEIMNKEMRYLLQNLCLMLVDLCAALFGEVSGPDPEEFEPEILYTVIGHYPSSSSRKSGVHFVQTSWREKFCRFDYGPKLNMVLYGQKTPPDYDLKKVTMRVALYSSKNDRFVPLQNVQLLNKELANVVEYRILKRKQFNHMDYVWGRNMDKHLFPHISNTLHKYN